MADWGAGAKSARRMIGVFGLCGACVLGASTRIGTDIRPGVPSRPDGESMPRQAPATTGALGVASLSGIGADVARDAPSPARTLPFPQLPALPDVASVTGAPKDLAALLRDPAPVFTPSPLLDEASARRFSEIIALYRRGEREAADDGAREVLRMRPDPALRRALDWVAIRSNRQGAGLARLQAFLAEAPDFPMAQWVRRRAELALVAERTDGASVRAFFAVAAPEMAAGKLALAQALAQTAATQTSPAEAAKGVVPKVSAPTNAAQKERSPRDVTVAALARSAYRDHQMSASLEQQILSAFPDAIGPDDHRFLALKYAFAEDFDDAQRVAKRAGGPLPALVTLLSTSIRSAAGAKALVSSAPDALKADAAFAFAKARLLRVSEAHEEAAKVLIEAPNAPEIIVSPEAWWEERRLHVRKLVEIGKPDLAHAVAARHRGGAPETLSDAAFHAGWVALRFLDDAPRARPHFATANDAAKTRQDKARALYWLGRTEEAAGEPGKARAAFTAAAAHSHTYYGQLAAERIGIAAFPEQAEATEAAAAAFAHSTIGKVIRLLLDHGGREFATPLIYDFAHSTDDPHKIAALGDMLAGYRDPRLVLLVGKTAIARAIAPERHAFPIFGIPPFDPAPGSAETPLVYAIARQESAFNATAVSRAGARGLMQLLPATAASTARRFGLPFDAARLTSDPAANAQLGAAHLGELLQAYDGSYILTFVAYNAGPGRAKDWVKRFGDPRAPGIDPIDWVEKIPFTETRNYVQRVLENLQVYRARMHGDRRIAIQADLTRRLAAK